MKKMLVLLVLIGLGVGGYYYADTNGWLTRAPQKPNPAERGMAQFGWSYRSVVENEIPYTDVSLIATYENGESKVKNLGKVEGSCNDYMTPDSDSYEKSQMIICYGAGIGSYFKVVATGSEYAVQRKVFEEALPEQSTSTTTTASSTATSAYETVASFPL